MSARLFRSLGDRFRSFRRTPAGRAVLRHAAAWAVVGAVILLVHRQVSSFVAGAVEPRPADPELVRVELPDWMEGLQGAEDLRAALQRVKGGLFDEESVRRAYEELRANPWVREVRAVRRDGLDGVAVELDLRRPAVAVNLGTRIVLIDDRRIRLPGDYAAPPPCLDAPMIALRDVPPAPGEEWTGPAMDAAGEMLWVYAQSPLLRERLRIASIQIEGSGRPSATFVLDSGGRIEWGSVPSCARPGEPTYVEKLEALRQYESQWPGLRRVLAVRLDAPVQNLGRAMR